MNFGTVPLRKMDASALSASKPTVAEHIVIIGGGLVGSLCAVSLAKMGYSVTLVEKTAHIASTVKRSINLALSLRGQQALNKVGLLDLVMELTIPMHARAIHLEGGGLRMQPYDEVDESNFINSISRELLNNLLLETAVGLHNVKVVYGMKLMHIDKSNVLHFQDTQSAGSFNDSNSGSFLIEDADLIIGCDGVYSTVRESMSRLQPMDFSRKYISHGYKELEIRPSESGEYLLPEPHSLHIWPRGDFMMIALPNLDKSFTCTIFAPLDELLALDTNDELSQSYFEKHFHDVIRFIPDFVQQFKVNPTCRLVTSASSPWNLASKIILLGDAAHAMVPFYGQGMNCGMEDVLELTETIHQCNMNLDKAIPMFAAIRKPRGEAMMQLSMSNYLEMRSHTSSPLFLLRKKFEGLLNWMLPGVWIPIYKMVAFTRIPYDEAIAREQRQDRILALTIKTCLIITIGTGSLFLLKSLK